MKIAFFSNYLTHHQLPFCEELKKIEGVDFIFVASEKITEERLLLGYEDMNRKYNFVFCIDSSEDAEKARRIADEADIVILGSAPMDFVKNRLKNNKLTFRYTERLFKKRCRGLELLKVFLIQQRLHAFHPSLYLLAASAYAPGDYQKMRLFSGKSYRWGYFPETKIYDSIQNLMEKKEKNSILWCGRLIGVKHPEIAIEVAKRLKEHGKTFCLNIVGCGEMEGQLREQVQEYGLESSVRLLGSMSPQRVREYMESSEIFLFTSDRREGWGAVLNEAMNSGCAVVASHAIGSVPFLLEDNKNGMIYRDGDIDSLYEKLLLLMNNKDICRLLGEKAYLTITEEWCASVAAKRFVILCGELLKRGKAVKCFDSGPCSMAQILPE